MKDWNRQPVGFSISKKIFWQAYNICYGCSFFIELTYISWFSLSLIGASGQIPNILLKSEAIDDKVQDNSSESKNPTQENGQVQGFYVELPLTKEITLNNSISISISKCAETAKNILSLETDIPGDTLLHWGVCRDDLRKWEVPPTPHPPETVAFKDRALRTLLKVGIRWAD